MKRKRTKSKQPTKRIRPPDPIDTILEEDSKISFDCQEDGNPIKFHKVHASDMESISSVHRPIRLQPSCVIEFDQLTDDCLLHVFALLTNKELLVCVPVCHRWKRLLNRLLIRRLRRQRVYLRQINLPVNVEKTFTQFDLFDIRQPTDVRSLLVQAQNVQQLKVQAPSRKYTFRLSQLMCQQQLRYLSLELYNDDFFLGLRQLQNRPLKLMAQQLQVFRLYCQEYHWLDSGENLLHLFASFPQLRSCQLSNFNRLHSESVGSVLLNKQLNVRQLSIASQPLPDSFPSLVELRMPSCALQKEADLAIFDRLPSLRKLIVRAVVPELAHQWLAPLGQRLISLKLLHVHCTNRHNYEGLLGAICQLRRVERLQMNSDRLFVGGWLRRQLQVLFNSCEQLGLFRLNGFELDSNSIRMFERFARFVNRKGDTVTNAVNAFKQERKDQLVHLNAILQRTHSLRISSGLNLNKFRLLLLGNYFGRLRQLSITFNLVTLDDLLIELMQAGLPELEQLDLRNTNHVTDRSLTRLASHFGRLQQLNVLPSRMNANITSRTWKHLSQLQQLQQLHMRHVTVDADVVLDVIQNMDSLFTVQLSNCQGITQFALRTCIQEKLHRNSLVAAQQLSIKSGKAQRNRSTNLRLD